MGVDQIVAELAAHPNGIAVKYADRLQEEVERSYGKWRERQPADRNGLPVIKNVAGQIARMVDELQDALIDLGLSIFVRGGHLVEPITRERAAAHDRKTMVTLFATLEPPKLAYLLNKYSAAFVRFDGRREQWVETDPPDKLTKMLATLREWKFAEVGGIISAPTLRPDGSILSAFGYDGATRLYCNSVVELPPIPQRPSKAQAKAALALLKELLIEFPFVAAEDRAVALAGILSAVLRGAYDIAPLFAIIAHASGSGKSFLVDLIACMVTGRNCPVITPSEKSEELEKVLGSMLLEGSTINSLDNMSLDIHGDLLAQIITQSFVKTRILGKSEIPECEWRGLLFATGNNIRVIGDMIRRTLSCNLDAKVENPELRRFEFDPKQRVSKCSVTSAGLKISVRNSCSCCGVIRFFRCLSTRGRSVPDALLMT